MRNESILLTVTLLILGLLILIPSCLSAQGAARDSWIIPYGSPIYGITEEEFLESGIVPPFEDTPVVSGELEDSLKRYGIEDPGIALPFYPVSPVLETGFYAGYNSEPEEDKIHYINTGDKSFLDYLPLYRVNSLPSILKAGFIMQTGGWSVLFQPEIREAMPSLLSQDSYTNLPKRFLDLDENFPYRGFISYQRGALNLTAARDKLQLGPGRWSSMSVNKNMPYFDYLRFRLNLDWFAFSSYLIRLNPIITPVESNALESMDASANPEVNARYETPFSEKSKHLAIHKLFLKPLPWFTLGIAELNMIGGRSPQLADFNPVLIFHNNFAEGCNNQSMSVTASLVPLPGIELYGEYYLYDAVVADEKNPSYKPGASGYQAGLTLLSTPYFNAGPGRIRIDGEFSLVDPWSYARWYDLKKYTSRIVYVETGAGKRNWVDYPLGYYLGPDVMDINARLSYGKPGKWDIYFHWNRSGIGSINLYGWGDNSLFSHTTEGNLPLSGAPTERDSILSTGIDEGLSHIYVMWRNLYTIGVTLNPLRGMDISGWFSYIYTENDHHVGNRDVQAVDLGVSLEWKVF